MQIRESGRRPLNRSPFILSLQQLRRNCHRRWRQYQLKMFGLWSPSQGRVRRSCQEELEALAARQSREKEAGVPMPAGGPILAGTPKLAAAAEPVRARGNEGPEGPAASGLPPVVEGISGLQRLLRRCFGPELSGRHQSPRRIGGGEGAEPGPGHGSGASAVPWYSGPLEGQGDKGSRDPRRGRREGKLRQPDWSRSPKVSGRSELANRPKSAGAAAGKPYYTRSAHAAGAAYPGAGYPGAGRGGRDGPGGRFGRQRSIAGTGRRGKAYGRSRFPLIRCLIFAALIWWVVPYCTAALESQGIIRPREGTALSVDSRNLPEVSLPAGEGGGAAGLPEPDDAAASGSGASFWKRIFGLGSGEGGGENASGQKIRLYEYKSGQLLEMDLEEYLVGVVAGEMPASFELEALKAQAIAARTYSVSKIVKGASPALAEIEPEADITNDTNINQTWLSEAERKANWGKNFSEKEARIRQAVQETKDVVLLYQGQIIDPLYHSSCGGERTEDPVNVWGSAVPYLQSVACSGHQDPYSSKTTIISLEEADKRLGTQLEAVTASASAGSRSRLCQVTDRSASGRVLSASVSGKEFSGTELRSRLELPSANFRAAVTAQGLEITSKGYGHGVGMCQYGANDYAKKGLNDQQILLHYYTGCTLARLSGR
ncbi:MAG: stage II sporulation protein D [Peptococcaceae bacterium]|nr:stage II sporulation protein D [Peptococcaceae bacterium]